MMYMGGKFHIAPKLVEAILQDSNWFRTPDTWFVEPFVGGANITKYIAHHFVNVLASDINVHLIELFKALQRGWKPPTSISEEEYAYYKQLSVYPLASKDSPLIAFVGFGCSYSGKWFGGYARGAEGRNYCNEARNSLLKIIPILKSIRFTSCSYQHLSIPPASVIYCDPPYADTTKYNYSENFNSINFLNWCNRLVEQGHLVYVSEYTAPPSWRSIWSSTVVSGLDQLKIKMNKEQLFTK